MERIVRAIAGTFIPTSLLPASSARSQGDRRISAVAFRFMERHVPAVEAFEGTHAAILRADRLNLAIEAVTPAGG